VIQVVFQSNVTPLVNGARPETSLDEVSELIRQRDAVVWVDIVDPTKEEITRVGEEFGFHPLALEDVVQGDQRPKLDHYEGYRFIVFYGLTLDTIRCRSHEVNIFIGERYMVTFHDSGLKVIADAAERWRGHPEALGKHDAGFLLYSLLDTLVDGYFPVIDEIAERADHLEESIIVGGQPTLQAAILQLRRDLLMIRRVAGPERDVLNEMIRRDPPFFSQDEIVYFQDVYDHLLRVTEMVDISRDVLSGLLDANLSMVSYQLNVLVKRLTSFSIILMSTTLVAGIYGMNFDNMPELHWTFGYPFALGLMALIAFVEIRLFKHIDWL
jgi:magnesium transporter